MKHARKPYRSRSFLAFAKGQRGPCCVCENKPGAELHHIGDKGMGQKATDLLVARVCPGCHERVQGKRALAFRRSQDWETWVSLQRDALSLLCAYVEDLEGGRMLIDAPDDDEGEYVECLF